NALASGGQLLLQLLDAACCWSMMALGTTMLGGRDGAGARLALLHPRGRRPLAPDDDRMVEAAALVIGECGPPFLDRRRPPPPRPPTFAFARLPVTSSMMCAPQRSSARRRSSR